MSKIELLAPAKNLECGIAAFDCGADAVYIGAASYGARSAVGNGLDDIASLVEYAHRYWGSVYVPVNTILYDDEIDNAVRLVHDLYTIGVDGIIIQDVGLLECDLPPIPVFASTQMHNESPEKVKFLEDIGISRVILARELELDKIKLIKSSTNVDLEVFVHGAICVSYSGRCYMSYAQGGRSANRGACAQPCRKPYRLVDGTGTTIAHNKHLLSTRDLNLSENLEELIDAGVTSFKIEGRLKDRDYVTNVVTYYRRKLDEVLSVRNMRKSSSGKVQTEFHPDLDKTFQRGYSTYFLHGRDHSISSMDTPKMTGERLGKVVSKDYVSFVLETTKEIHRGDGLCYFDKTGTLQGFLVNDVRVIDTQPLLTLTKNITSLNPSLERRETTSPSPFQGEGWGEVDSTMRSSGRDNLQTHGSANPHREGAFQGEGWGEVDSTMRSSGRDNLQTHGSANPHREGAFQGKGRGEVKIVSITPAHETNVAPDTEIFRNHDHAFLETLKKIRIDRRIDVCLTLSETVTGVLLTAIDEDGVSVSYPLECEKTLAQKTDQAIANIERQLSKSGDTEYAVKKVNIELTAPLFFPVSMLNGLRRDTLDLLTRERRQTRPQFDRPIVKNEIEYPEKDLTYEANVLNEKAVAFYRRHGVGEIEAAAESGLDLSGKRVMTTRYCVKYEMDACKRYKKDAIKLMEPLSLVDDAGEKLNLKFDCKNCRMEVWMP